jgi:protein ImuB
MFAAIYIPDLPSSRHEDLKQVAESFSPLVEMTGCGLALLDIRGLRTLCGDTSQIASAIEQRTASLGWKAQVAVAANPNAAIVAARGYDGVTVIPLGQEGRALASLSLDLLSPADDVRQTLEAWGIHTFADLAALPERGLAERLGIEGLRLQKMARGLASRPLMASIDAAVFEDSMEMEHPLELLEPLSFVLNRLLNNICTRLLEHSLAANQIELRLALEDSSEHIRILNLPFAGRDHLSFLKLLQYDLAAHPPAAAIVRVYLRLQPVEPRVVQNGLFLPLAPEPEKLELTLARIAAIVGEHNAGSPRLLDTHRPDAFELRKFDAAAKPAQSHPAQSHVVQSNSAAPKLAMRLFRPPLSARVLAPFGHPQKIAAAGINGPIAAFAGPWRASGDWWNANSWARDEWDIALESGALYRIYCERQTNWFIEGNYD